MPETEADGALETVQRIRASLASDDVVGGKLTLSIGITQFPEGGATPEALLAGADAALYQAKRAGRDRVVHPAR
jgi:diguanylate cyclase (GGDEF)-like protein